MIGGLLAGALVTGLGTAGATEYSTSTQGDCNSQRQKLVDQDTALRDKERRAADDYNNGVGPMPHFPTPANSISPCKKTAHGFWELNQVYVS